MGLIGRGEIMEATSDVVSMLQEHEGDPVEDRMARFGFAAADVADVLHDRWEADKPNLGSKHAAFARGWVEGLLTGRRLGHG